MTLHLPEEWGIMLRRLDRAWPVSDEQVLLDTAQAFSRLRAEAQSSASAVEDALLNIEDTNSPLLTGSVNYFLSTEANLSSLKDFADASEGIGGGFELLAGTVVALKATIVGHLALLATLRHSAARHGELGAIAYTAALTETRRLMDEAVQYAIAMVQGSEDTEDTEPDDGPRPEELERLSAWADSRQDAEDYEAVAEIWRSLLDQLPEPALEHPLAMWAHASLGDALFQVGQFEQANAALAQALLAGATDEAFVWLRKGQSLVELGDEKAGVEALTSAYLLMGDEILDDEDPKYQQLLAKLDIAQG